MTSLDVSHEGLTTLGVLSTRLIRLYRHYNRLSSLCVSSLVNLTKLYCYSNRLTSLDELSALTNLTKLYCHYNQLTSLDGLSALTNLTKLYCYNNQLTSLDGLSALTNLTKLYCYNNQLTSLDGLAALTNLTHLYCSNNQLTSLDGLSALTNLTSLHCGGNQLTSLDGLSALVKLVALYCHNNRTLMILPSMCIHEKLTYINASNTSLPRSLLEKQGDPTAFRGETERLARIRCATVTTVAVFGIARRKRVHRDVLGLVARAVWQTRGAEAWSYEVVTKRRKDSDEEST